MQNIDLDKIIIEIKNRGLTAYEISKALPLSEAGINKILSGTSEKPRKSTLLLLHNYLFGEKNGKSEVVNITNEKTPPEEARCEDMLAATILEKLMPIINKVLDSHQKIIKELLQQGLEIDELLDEVQELKETTSSILKEVKELH